MEVKRQILYSVLLGRDHHDRRPRSPEDGTLKNKLRTLKNKLRTLKNKLCALKNKVRDKVELSKNKVRAQKIRFGIRLSKVESKVEDSIAEQHSTRHEEQTSRIPASTASDGAATSWNTRAHENPVPPEG